MTVLLNTFKGQCQWFPSLPVTFSADLCRQSSNRRRKIKDQRSKITHLVLVRLLLRREALLLQPRHVDDVDALDALGERRELSL